MDSIPEKIQRILHSSVKILSENGKEIEALILSSSKFELQETDYDNWNGGTIGYTLTLRIPIGLYSKHINEVRTYEKTLKEQLELLLRTYTNEYIKTVIIDPILIDSIEPKNFVIQSDEKPYEEIKCWKPNFFRLFLCHTSDYKTRAASLQSGLLKYGVSAFVAHNDIEPTQEWQKEIETALSSMDALAALLSPDFNSSKWCDQEVGIAVGQNILVIPIRMGQDPYGFIGKFQGLKGFAEIDSNFWSQVVARNIFDLLFSKENLRMEIAKALVYRLSSSRNFQESINTIKLIEQLGNYLTRELIDVLSDSVKSNRQVSNAFGVPEAIERLKTQ